MHIGLIEFLTDEMFCIVFHWAIAVVVWGTDSWKFIQNALKFVWSLLVWKLDAKNVQWGPRCARFDDCLFVKGHESAALEIN